MSKAYIPMIELSDEDIDAMKGLQHLTVAISQSAYRTMHILRRQTGLSGSDIVERLLERADTSPLGRIAMFTERFPGWSVETTDPVPTPHNVSIDIYGEEFNFRASADEARRLIKLMERVLAARKDVTRLKRELAAAEAKSFVGVGIGDGIVVDDPDGGALAQGERVAKGPEAA
jgi:hypothetical protein